MKAWLKGGFILAGIDFLFWLIFFIGATQSRGDMAGLAVVGALVYGGLSLIPAFIIGAIIGGISGFAYVIEKKVITWSSMAGFFSSLIIYIIFFSYAIYHDVSRGSSFTHALQVPGWPPYVLGIFVIIAVTWVFWVIGAIIKKVRG